MSNTRCYDRQKQLGRVYLAVNPAALNLPRLSVCADGECVVLGLSYGNASSDPVALLEVMLTGTRAARPIAAAYWSLRKHLERRR